MYTINFQSDYKENNIPIELEFQDEGVVLADLPEWSGLVNFIDKTLTLSNQNIIQVLSETLDNNKKQSEKYSITFHDLLEGFKYDCHVITEQLKGVKDILGNYFATFENIEIGSNLKVEKKSNYSSDC